MNIAKKQLHIFCDSSQLAYGAVAYLKEQPGNETNTAFIMAKTKVEAVKKETLSRLKLNAALLGSKLCEYLNKTLQLNTTCDIIYQSDSQIVLS